MYKLFFFFFKNTLKQKSLLQETFPEQMVLVFLAEDMGLKQRET